MSRKRMLIGVGMIMALIALPLAWYLISPLFINVSVDEPFPPSQAVPSSHGDTLGALPRQRVAMPMRDEVTPQFIVPGQRATATPRRARPTATPRRGTAQPTRTPQPTRTTSPAPTKTAVPTSVPATPVPKQPSVLKTGQFHPVTHAGQGTATIYHLANGKHILRFENFSVLNGPDLYVYLNKVPDAHDARTVLDGGYISLGRLKGNQGNQNYALPDDLDLTQFHSVSIWCQRFTVNFATAPFR